MQRMHMEAFTQLTREPTEMLVHTCHVDRDVRMLNRSWIEERRHQREFEKLAAKVQLLAGLPAVPHVTHGENVFAKAWGRMIPHHTEAALDVWFDLCAEPHDETTMTHRLQVPTNVCECHWATRECD